MIKLQDTGLIEGLPPGIAEQHWVKVLDAVFRERQKKELEAVRKVFVYTAIDSAPENILDILAVQFKVDWYRDDYPIETKRRVIKTAMEVRRYCGTEWAVKQAISAIYPNSEIVEWYDYNGTPGHWRLRVNITENADIAYYTIKRMESLLGYARRCTAHLEGICDMDMTEHSKKFHDVKSYYDHRIWSKATVAKSVKKGWITAEEYAEIVGEPYAA